MPGGAKDPHMNQQGDVSNASAGAISFVCLPWKDLKPRREKTNPAPSGELTAQPGASWRLPLENTQNAELI